MERIEAIFRPERLNLVKDALAGAGLVGLNVTQVTGRGTQRGIEVGGPRGVGTYTVDMLPKVKLELVVREDQTQQRTSDWRDCHDGFGALCGSRRFLWQWRPVSDVHFG